jgi:poly [ADP-ribose] polymerase 16
MKIRFISNIQDSGAEGRFQQLKTSLNFETKFAYHGTRFYNIYSILNYGLQQHLNKTGLFGEGLYFADELGKYAYF